MPPLDDALPQIEALCATLRLTSEVLVDAANVLAPADADDAEVVDTVALEEAVDAAEDADEQNGRAVGLAVAALRACAALAREGAEGPVATGHADVDAALAAAEKDAAEWRSRVEEAGDELEESGFVPAVTALDAVTEAAERAVAEQRAAGEALHAAASTAVHRLAEVQTDVGFALDEAAASAASVVEAFERARWEDRWDGAPGVLEDTYRSAGDGVRGLYADWVAAVETALSAQEEAVSAAATTAGDALSGAWATLESTVAECLEKRQGLRTELGELALVFEQEEAAAPELAAVGEDLAVALSIAAIVEAALQALKE
jgi:hypothetical protein